MTERLHFDCSLSCTGEGNGNPLQYSCLENPRDGGSWWAAVYGVTQSRTRLKRLSSSSSSRGVWIWSLVGELRSYMPQDEKAKRLKKKKRSNIVTDSILKKKCIMLRESNHDSSCNYRWTFQVALVVKNASANAGDVKDVGSVPGLGRPPERGHGNPPQCSCLENPQG